MISPFHARRGECCGKCLNSYSQSSTPDCSKLCFGEVIIFFQVKTGTAVFMLIRKEREVHAKKLNVILK